MQLGKTQPLRIVKKVDFGVYLAEEEDQENRVLLPVKQVPEGATLYYAWKGGKAESKRSDKDWCIS